MSIDSDERFTPKKYINSVKKVFGGIIDLDPYSSIAANTRIGAKRIFTLEDPSEALNTIWEGKVFCNPPYSRGHLPKIVHHMYMQDMNEVRTGKMSEGILLVHNWTERKWFQKLLSEYPVCLTDHRIEYLRYNTLMKKFVKMKNPENGSAFFYFGTEVETFYEEFRQYGTIVKPLYFG